MNPEIEGVDVYPNWYSDKYLSIIKTPAGLANYHLRKSVYTTFANWAASKP